MKTPTLTRPSKTVTAKIRRSLPLVADLGDIPATYGLTDHAIERCQERGIGIFEVYSAIADPGQVIHGNDARQTLYHRGDVGVAVNPKIKSIVTVLDLNQDTRTTPRIPLNPLTQGGRTVTQRRGKTAALKGESDRLDEAWALVVHKEPDFRVIYVSPEFAEKLLTLNTHNRPLRRWNVDIWKAKLETGEYRTTHQGVAIDSKGVLQDGQYRLAAITETGIGANVLFAVGMDPGNFDVIDAGRPRNYADTLALSGEGDVFALGATIRLVYLFLTRDSYPSWSKTKISNHLVMEEFAKDPDGYRDALSYGRMITVGVRLTRTAAGAAFYVVNRVNRRATVEEFFDGLVTGADLHRGDPRLMLARNLRKAAERHERAVAAEHLALTIKTWNAWAEGDQEVRVFAWKRNEPMPRVIKLER